MDNQFHKCINGVEMELRNACVIMQNALAAGGEIRLSIGHWGATALLVDTMLPSSKSCYCLSSIVVTPHISVSS